MLMLPLLDFVKSVMSGDHVGSTRRYCRACGNETKERAAYGSGSDAILAINPFVVLVH
jgi:hypothetical protein